MSFLSLNYLNLCGSASCKKALQHVQQLCLHCRRYYYTFAVSKAVCGVQSVYSYIVALFLMLQAKQTAWDAMEASALTLEGVLDKHGKPKTPK